MAKPSKLTPSQWGEIKRRHIVDGISIRQLAREYDIGEKTIRDYLKKNPNSQNNQNGTQTPADNPAGAKERIGNAAIAVIQAAKDTGLPPDEVGIAIALANNMHSIRSRLGRLAEAHLGIALELSERTQAGMRELATPEGLIDGETLKGIAQMIDTANRAAYVGIEINKTNKPKDGDDDKNRQIIHIDAPND